MGGATTSLIQGLIILGIAFALGVPFPGVIGLIMTLVFMVFISFTAVGFGLILASKMRDMQSFPLIMNLIMMPLLLVSSAFFPLENLPPIISTVAKLNPMFYMVDGLRGSLIGKNNVFPPLVDFLVILVICIIILSLGNYFFSKSEV
jgi:ABC-2 type transport system permease protein